MLTMSSLLLFNETNDFQQHERENHAMTEIFMDQNDCHALDKPPNTQLNCNVCVR